MEIKVVNLNRCGKSGYNYDALKYFVEKAFEVEVVSCGVITEGYGFELNKDLVVRCQTPTGTYNYIIRKSFDVCCWEVLSMNGVNPYEAKAHISNSVMKLIYPKDNEKYTKYDIVKKIDAGIASGSIKSDNLYIDSICDVIDVIDGYELDGARMMERDIAILTDFASEYAKAGAQDAKYRYDMMKNTDISDDEKNRLMLSSMGLATGIDADLMAMENFMKDMNKNIAENSGVNTKEGVTYTFTSNGCSFKTFLN